MRAMGCTDCQYGTAKGKGLELECPESGCCGLAGDFGYEREHYEVSMRIGERVLLPAVRKASLKTLIIADGFSCRSRSSTALRVAPCILRRCCK
jgi:Fe-S oxidoreductase